MIGKEPFIQEWVSLVSQNLLTPRYQVENVPGGEYFKLRDGYGEPVSVQEDDDLLFLGKNTLWRVGHDMYRFAQRQTGMNWSEIWEQLTGENSIIQSISTAQAGQSIDFVELFNPANFKAQRASLVAGATNDVQANPAINLTRDTIRQQVRKDIDQEDPLILLGAPPCTVFSPLQNIIRSTTLVNYGKRRSRRVWTFCSSPHNVIGIKFKEESSSFMNIQLPPPQNTLTAYDTRTPRAIPWESVIVRRTINRKTGVVMAEDYTADLDESALNRPFRGSSPKEFLTVFFIGTRRELIY